MAVIEINDINFEEVIKENDKVLVDCFANWCGPCRMLSPVIDELSEEIKEVKFCKLDVDDNEEIARKYGIMSIPALLYFENGNLISKSVGFKPKEEIKEIFK